MSIVDNNDKIVDFIYDIWDANTKLYYHVEQLNQLYNSQSMGRKSKVNKELLLELVKEIEYLSQLVMRMNTIAMDLKQNIDRK
jgi:hypothetical protein